MNKALTSSRKAFTATVVAATISWSIGISALVAPIAAKAAVSGGTLVKASLPAVYYIGSDMKRYVFPNEKTFKTWYADFSSVMTITDAELASIPLAGGGNGNVTYKPGTRMVKITTDPKVYVVDAGGVLRPIASEAVASALYGSNWNQQIDDLADSFFTNYDLGAAVGAAADFNRTAVSAAATSINVDKGLGSGSSAAGVSMMKASDSPMGATLPLGATGVNFLKFSVSNSGSSAAVLSSLTVKRSGPGSASDFEAVYLYKGSERLTTGRSINSSSNEATFSGLNLSIPAGGSVSMWVAGDISDLANVGDVNSLSVSSAMVGSNAVSGAPLMGSSFNLAGAEVGSISIDATGTISNVKAGGMAQKVAQFSVTAGGEEDVDLHSISLTFDGDSRSNVSNLVLKQGGLTLASSSSINDKDLAVFALSNPMYMEKGTSRTFEVYADVAAGSRAGDMIAFYLDENSDLRAVGRTYGYGLMVDNADFTSSNGQDTEVEAGKLTTTFNGPASKDVSVNSKEVELYNFTMAAQSNLEVRQLLVTIDTDTDDVEDVLADVKIVDTASGAIVAGPMDPADDNSTTQVLEFNETWNLASGTARTFKVTADIVNDELLDGELITVTLGDGSLFNTNKVRNLDNSTYLTSADMVPSTELQGNEHEVQTAMLEVDNASSPVDTTYIKGAANVALGAWVFKAGDASSVKVNSITFDCAMDSGLCQDSLSSVKLMNGSVQLGESEQPDSMDVVTFDSLNLTINAGQTVTIGIYGTISNSASTPNDVEFTFDEADVVDADGADLDEDDNAITGPNMDIADEGVMAVVRAPSDTDTEAGHVIAGASNVVLAKYKFTAQNEDLKISKLKFSVGDETAVESLSLYDGSSLVGGPVGISNGEAEFSSMSVVVPKGSTSKTLTVKGKLVATHDDGGDPEVEADVTVTLEDSDYEFLGTTTNTKLDDADIVLASSIAGYDKYSVRSKLKFMKVGISTLLAAGDQVEVFKFTVTADAAGPVAFHALDLYVNNGTDVAVDCASTGESSMLEGDTLINGGCTGGTIAAAGNGTLSISFEEEQSISAGDSKTYTVLLDISGATSGSLSTRVESSGFAWSDMSQIDHDGDDAVVDSDGDDYVSSDWITDGDYIKGLGTQSHSMAF